MDSFLKHVFIRAGKHTTVHVVHPHNNYINYTSLFTNAFTRWIPKWGYWIQPAVAMRWDTSMLLDAAMWNFLTIRTDREHKQGGGLIHWFMYYNIRNTFVTNLPVDLLSSFCFIYLYICLCFFCIVICMHRFHSPHIFIVCNSVICTNSFNT